MAVGDQSVLLCEDAEAGPAWDDPLVVEPKRNNFNFPRKLAVVVSMAVGVVASIAMWRSHVVVSPVDHFSVEGVMSASNVGTAWNPFTNIKCPDVWPLMVWPRHFDDLNWEGPCDKRDSMECIHHLTEKFVGDYFDAVMSKASADVTDRDLIPPLRQQSKWKARVIGKLFEEVKVITDVAGRNTAPWQPVLGSPDAAAEAGAICAAIYEERPIVTAAKAKDCHPNYLTHRSFTAKLATAAPPDNTKLSATGITDAALPPFAFPADHGWERNTSLENCRNFLTHHAMGQDWIEAAVAVMDVRMCLESKGGAKAKNSLSRSFVADCIPDTPTPDPRTIGWPGFVFEFVSEYGIPLDSCIPNYKDYFARGRCPSLCDNGESLAGQLKRLPGKYEAIWNRDAAGTLLYKQLLSSQHHQAKHHIYMDGPVVGLVLSSERLAACARDDGVVYGRTTDVPSAAPAGNCPDNWADGKLANMHSVVVHGWGSASGKAFYRIMSSAFQDEDHDAKILECAVKVFVVPSKAPTHVTSWYSAALGAFGAEAVCPHRGDFCKETGAGYSASEDCDGDGVLDHWCYRVGGTERPSYEAYISSRAGCSTVEGSCRRSVLPGRRFGCQRPLGWCMHEETYRRDQDCDGDGHYDHICERDGHNGFISSAQNCIDTWEEGTVGRKCEPAAPLLQDQDASALARSAKFAYEDGSCIQVSPMCVASHHGFPSTPYPNELGCNFHISWRDPSKVTAQAETDCDEEDKSNYTLYLEVLHLGIEQPHYFGTSGWWYGDRLSVDTKLVEKVGLVQVYDKSKVAWIPDLTVAKEGWLVCLRVRRTIPAVYHTTCAETADDIWEALNVTVGVDYVNVECDMTKCRRAAVKASGTTKDIFMRTDNVCDAGWQVMKSSTFSILFLKHDAAFPPRFSVLA